MADTITPDTITTIRSEIRKKVGIYTDEDIQGIKTFKKKQIFEKGFNVNGSDFDEENIALKSETNALEIKLSEGKNYINVLATGTAAENFAELQAKYDLLNAYKGAWSSTSAYAINEIVLSGGLYYKRKTVGSSFSFPNPSGTQDDTAYWQYVEQQADSPFEGIYDLDNVGPKNMALNEYIQMFVEEYDESEELVFSGYNKYKCIQAITFPVTPALDIINWELYTGNVYLTPSSSNRYTLVLAPGYYTGTFVSNNQYVDIVSLTGNRDINISGFEALANNVHIKGIVTTSTRFVIGNNLASLVVENCLSKQDRSFCVSASSVAGSSNIVSGTFIDCEGTTGTNSSFGYSEICSGTFIRVKGARIFSQAKCTGIFTDCISTEGVSFGWTSSSASYLLTNANGTFYNCISKKSGAFGSECNGKFINCIVEIGSGFGASTTTSDNLIVSKGEFYNCHCLAGWFAGCYGTTSGTTANILFAGKAFGCSGGWGSFGGLTPEGGMDGVLINCLLYGRQNTGFTTDVPEFKALKARECTVSVAAEALITRSNHNKKRGDIVRFTSTDTLPAGLLADTDYYILESGFTANTFKVSTTPNGSPITTTDAGTGTHSVILGRYMNCVDGTGAIINTKS